MFEFLAGGVCAGGSFILLVVLAALFFELPLWVFFTPYILCVSMPCLGALLNLPDTIANKSFKEDFDSNVMFCFTITVVLSFMAFLVRNYNCKDVLFWIVTLIQKIF